MSGSTFVKPSADENKKYYDSVHRLGRSGSIIAIVLMVGAPIVLGFLGVGFPPLGVVLQALGGLLATFLPITISEVFSYAPVLGSASYITFITGEVSNIKIPVALNALKVAGIEQSTDEGDAIVTLAVSIASLFAMGVLLVGVIVFLPLSPVLELPAVVTATSNILPALFGSLILVVFANRSGKYVVKNKYLSFLPAFIICTVLMFLIPILANLLGVLILVMLPVTIGISWVLYQKKIIRVYEDGIDDPLPPHERKKK